MVNRPDDEELALRFWGEHPDPEAFDRAMAADPELARRYRELAGALGALEAIEAPEPRAGLEGRIWARVAPELAGRRARARFLSLPSWPRLATLAAAAAALAVGGFLAGRATGPAPDPAAVEASLDALSPEARDRLLAAALAGHLDSSERLMVELVNDGQPSDEMERQMAATLLESNRLYRSAAERAGQRRIAAVLAELEPLLAELANAPADGDVTAAARERIDAQDLLFRVRVTRGNLTRSRL
ncbi:MAG: hypothetical protein AMXMBFR36_18220 [Acidobacteriota bacterium]